MFLAVRLHELPVKVVLTATTWWLLIKVLKKTKCLSSVVFSCNVQYFLVIVLHCKWWRILQKSSTTSCPSWIASWISKYLGLSNWNTMLNSITNWHKSLLLLDFTSFGARCLLFLDYMYFLNTFAVVFLLSNSIGEGLLVRRNVYLSVISTLLRHWLGNCGVSLSVVGLIHWIAAVRTFEHCLFC